MAAVVVGDFSSRELWNIYSAIIEGNAGVNSLLDQGELFEVFNGDFMGAGVKIQSLFEQKSGSQRSVAYMLMSKNNAITADLLDDLQSTLYTGSMTEYVVKTLNNTGLLIKQGAVQLRGLTIVNPNTYDVWLKFYDKASAPTIGTDTTINKFQVPANGSIIIDTTAQVKNKTILGLGVGITKNYLDTDVVAVATNCELFLQYKF